MILTEEVEKTWTCVPSKFCLQVKPIDTNIICQESGKDPVIITVMKSKFFGNCWIHSVSTMDASSRDQELSFHRAYSTIS